MTAKRLITGILALLVIAVVMAPSLMAQSLISGDLTGTVTDPSGAVVSGAAVTLKSDATGATRTATTGSNGNYRFSLLSPGNYTITVTAPNFAKAQAATSVSVGQATIADVKLTVGATSQTVEVTSAAPLVQAESADLSTNFNQSLVANQPNGGNDLTYVAQTAPGVMMNVGQGYGNFSSYGLPATSNLFTVNGENDMDPYLNLNNSGATNLTLGRNEVQEATVINNAYSGQYGQQAGAQVNYVTKSGTNAFHGDVEYWWTGRAMDANDWFNLLAGVPRPFANNNEWAASLGGPIKKDKLFFFVNHEGIRYIVPSSTPVYVPTTTFVNNTLANLTATAPQEVSLYSKLFNLYQNSPFYSYAAANNNLLPGSCGDAEGIIPAFTADNCFGTTQATPALPGTEWILSGRIDYNVSDADHLWWRVRMDHGTQATQPDAFSPALSAASYQPAYDGQGQWNHVFSPNATNQFIYAGSYYRAIFTQKNPLGSGFEQLGQTYSLIGVGFNIGDGNLITNYAYAFPQGRNVTQYQFVDDFSWTKGAHAFKFGANFRRYDITDFAFSTINNPEVLLLSQADFYNGIAFQTRENFPSRGSMPVALWGLGVYAQDEWRVNKSLKLTFALRAEHNSNPVCQLNCASILNGEFSSMAASGLTNPALPYNQIVDFGRHQIFRSTDTLNWAPRFGFAWSPGGSDKTVVRGGFGLFYDAFPAVIGDAFMTNPPNEVNVRVTGAPWGDTTTPASPYLQGQATAAAIMAGFPAGLSWQDLHGALDGLFRTPSFNTQAGTFHTPYWEQWSLGIQQAIGDKTAVGLGYVGNHGVRIPINNEGLNAFDPGGTAGFPLIPPSGCSSPSCLGSAPFGVVQQYSSAGISNYNGLTATFNQRVTYGFTVQASYTWSHTFDEESNAGGEPYNGNSSFRYQINPFCLRCNNYGPADYDIRSYFSASYVWQTPWKFSNKFANGAFGGWTLSQNFFARTGLPFTVLDGNTVITNFGPSNIVADIVPGVPIQQSCTNGLSQCVNPNGFVSAGTTFPIQRRNSFRGPGFFDSDFTINKNFKLTERVAFGVGANFYNVFNHPNFTNPDSTFGDSTFGQILTTTAPPTGPYGSFFPGLPSGRIIQFQGKIVF
ncbi:MAG TPA: carboxypeptidase regulatory-like domain-containing protein [Candidatus Binatia bacterium]|nr:carboxypeptidase regulatory-like domain-containing protein [Candidatus Binatia bacterium]